MWEDLGRFTSCKLCNLLFCCSRFDQNIRSAEIWSRFSVGLIKSDGLILSSTVSSPLTSFCSQFFCHSFQCQFNGHRFKQYTDPYRYTRSFLIGSPFKCLSSAPLHEPHKGTIIHHTPNLFRHFSFAWKIRARGHIDFIKNMKLRLQKWNICLLSIIALITMTDRKKKKRNTHLGLTPSEGHIWEMALWNIFVLICNLKSVLFFPSLSLSLLCFAQS